MKAAIPHINETKVKIKRNERNHFDELKDTFCCTRTFFGVDEIEVGVDSFEL